MAITKEQFKKQVATLEQDLVFWIQQAERNQELHREPRARDLEDHDPELARLYLKVNESYIVALTETLEHLLTKTEGR